MSRRDQKENATMATQPLTTPKQNHTVEDKAQQLRQLYAGAPEYAKTALEKSLKDLTSFASKPRARVESAGRAGIRQGKVSELTLITPFAPGGAARLRALLQLRDGSFDDTDLVGTVHDMRFVFLDNDTKLLFATAYDGDFDPYIDDFATKITDQMDVIFSACEGWPGIRSPKVKDWIVKHQITAEGWYVAHPDLTVRDIQRVKRVGKAVDEFLDKLNS